MFILIWNTEHGFTPKVEASAKTVLGAKRKVRSWIMKDDSLRWFKDDAGWQCFGHISVRIIEVTGFKSVPVKVGHQSGTLHFWLDRPGNINAIEVQADDGQPVWCYVE